MATVYDVPPNKLIKEVSKEIKNMDGIKEPEWSKFVKTGVHKEKAPDQADWWFDRVSALFRSVYVEGPVGISRLRTKYGGKQRRGPKPEKFVKGSGSIIREGLQQLEAANLVEKTDDGRVVTSEGQAFLDDIAHEIMKEMAKDNPDLSKYL
ncbi:MAG: 30S ribosomal protein S19e [Candidatus Thermoplasmatota archaeon]|nr:30S ribosomal protein S19e [Candidatus Thermoplasmatota archaeon]MBS3789939.1 30S ribosomal protein S19e [Candidatus Thermoplasmatota archaeon]